MALRPNPKLPRLIPDWSEGVLEDDPDPNPVPVADPATPLITITFCGAPRLAVFPVELMYPVLPDPTKLAPVALSEPVKPLEYPLVVCLLVVKDDPEGIWLGYEPVENPDVEVITF